MSYLADNDRGCAISLAVDDVVSVSNLDRMVGKRFRKYVDWVVRVNHEQTSKVMGISC